MKINKCILATLLIFCMLLSSCGDGPTIKDSTNAHSATATGSNASSSSDKLTTSTTEDDELSNNLSENNNNYVVDKSINHDNEDMENADNLENKDNSSQTNDSENGNETFQNNKKEPNGATNEASSVESNFYSTEITSEILSRIKGKSYPADNSSCKVSVEDLRYCHVLHYGFDGQAHEGEIIVNKAIAEDILDIFEKLYEKKYPIERMVLVDEYGADDETSMRANNTSAFNYRVVSGSTTLSNHSYGLAIDLNPLYNPYVVTKSDGSTEVQPVTAHEYADRYQLNAYFIRKYDDCYNLFIDHGFTWGGDWNTKKDYQHFEKNLTD